MSFSLNFNILGSSNPTAATKNVETAVFISRGREEASMDDESDLLHMQMAHLPLRLRLGRCVSELSLSDESPRRREKLTEGFNLKPLAPLCDLNQALRFACVDRGQTENSCCVKCPFCERFACVDRNVPWHESMSSEEFQILQVETMSAMSCNDFNCSRLQPHDLPVVYRGKQLHHLVYKRKAKQVPWLRHGDDVNNDIYL
ncbi:hypothetical protein HID58_080318 [Brassica napus]|uniref:Uncharacterized protein n=1 Tax=Brassica napus TaxID=3708 RepID=A0ABQ7Y4J7_BRANA|nr:hypothetical protein HID58_080318 [Brassica napus]